MPLKYASASWYQNVCRHKNPYSSECGELYDQSFIKLATGMDVQAIIDAKANVNVSDENGYTPLHIAAGWSGDPDIILDAN